MTGRKSRSGRIIGEVADLTGRSDAEVKLLVGGAVAAASVGVALRTIKALVELGASVSRHTAVPH